MANWIVTMVVNFVLRQIAKFSSSTDWVKVKADANARIAQLVPSWFLPSLSDIVSQAIDVLQAALADTADLSDIATKLISGDVSGALASLVAMVEKLIHLPGQPVVLAALKSAQSHV